MVHKGKTVAASAVRTVAFHLDSVLGFFFFLVWVSVLVSVSSSVSYLYLCLAGRDGHRQAGRVVISLVSAFFIDVSFAFIFFTLFFFAWYFSFGSVELASDFVAKRLTLHKVAS